MVDLMHLNGPSQRERRKVLASLEMMIAVNIISLVVFIIISFLLGWWFLRKQSNQVTQQAMKVVEQEVLKAKKQLIAINKKMMSGIPDASEPLVNYSAAPIDNKTIRAVEDIYKAFVVWGKLSSDTAIKISRQTAQELVSSNSVQQEEAIKGYQAEALKVLKHARQLEHQVQFDGAYLDSNLVNDMERFAKKCINQSQYLVDAINASANQVKKKTARETLKVYTSMERCSKDLISFQNMEYKPFVKTKLAEQVRELRAISLTDAE